MAPSHPSSAVRRFHPHLRDLWTTNVRRATSWVTVGSIALAAALVGLAAKETPARHTTGSTGASNGTTGTVPGSGTAGTPAGSGTPAPGSAPTGSATASSTAAATGSGTPATTSGSVVGPSGGTPQVSTGLS